MMTLLSMEQEASQGCLGAQARSVMLELCPARLRQTCQASRLGPSLLPADVSVLAPGDSSLVCAVLGVCGRDDCR